MVLRARQHKSVHMSKQGGKRYNVVVGCWCAKRVFPSLLVATWIGSLSRDQVGGHEPARDEGFDAAKPHAKQKKNRGTDRRGGKLTFV